MARKRQTLIGRNFFLADRDKNAWQPWCFFANVFYFIVTVDRNLSFAISDFIYWSIPINKSSFAEKMSRQMSSSIMEKFRDVLYFPLNYLVIIVFHLISTRFFCLIFKSQLKDWKNKNKTSFINFIIFLLSIIYFEDKHLKSVFWSYRAKIFPVISRSLAIVVSWCMRKLNFFNVFVTWKWRHIHVNGRGNCNP